MCNTQTPVKIYKLYNKHGWYGLRIQICVKFTHILGNKQWSDFQTQQIFLTDLDYCQWCCPKFFCNYFDDFALFLWFLVSTKKYFSDFTKILIKVLIHYVKMCTSFVLISRQVKAGQCPDFYIFYHMTKFKKIYDSFCKQSLKWLLHPFTANYCFAPEKEETSFCLFFFADIQKETTSFLVASKRND